MKIVSKEKHASEKKLPSGNKTEKNLSRIPSCGNKFKKLLMKKEI